MRRRHLPWHSLATAPPNTSDDPPSLNKLAGTLFPDEETAHAIPQLFRLLRSATAVHHARREWSTRLTTATTTYIAAADNTVGIDGSTVCAFDNNKTPGKETSILFGQQKQEDH